MGDRYKILGQLKQSVGAAAADLYSVPVAAATTAGGAEVSPKATATLVQSLVTSIIVCNVGSTGATFDIEMKRNANASGVPQYPPEYDANYTTFLFDDQVLADDNTKIIDLGLTLSPGDKITVDCAGADCHFTATGIEITTGRGPDA